MKNKGAPPTVWPMIWVAAFVALAHIAWGLADDSIIPLGAFADGDSYTRQLRALRLLETGDWFNTSLPRANAPFGASVHWTRPFDALLIGLGLPLVPVLGVTGALYWAGVLISPLLHLSAALILLWAVHPLIGRAGAVIAGAMTAAQFGTLGYATVGHSDHHMLFAPVMVGGLGLAIRCLEIKSRGLSLALGATLALGIWVGPEALILGLISNSHMGTVNRSWVVPLAPLCAGRRRCARSRCQRRACRFPARSRPWWAGGRGAEA